MRPTRTLVLAALVLSSTVAARAEEAMPGMPMHSKHKPAGPASPADKAFAAGMDKMMKDMAVTPTGDTDKDFVRMMIPHHEGAIAMAKVELRYGTDPLLRKLAEGIVAAQESEIAEMKAWLKAH